MLPDVKASVKLPVGKVSSCAAQLLHGVTLQFVLHAFFSMGYEESCLEIGKRDGFPLLGIDVCGAAVIGVIFFFFFLQPLVCS